MAIFYQQVQKTSNAAPLEVTFNSLTTPDPVVLVTPSLAASDKPRRIYRNGSSRKHIADWLQDCVVQFSPGELLR